MARRALALAWPLVLAAVLVVTIAPYGFNVVDEGLVLSYTHRLLDGQVPHVDFISPRPVGSSLIHALDLLPPFPEVLTSRSIGVVVIVAYSLAFAAVIFGRPPWRWPVPQSLGAAASVLVNLHTFPPMAWYTTDGLLLIALGSALLLAGRSPTVAMLLLGLAATTKQSFVPAILLGAGLVAWREGRLAPALRALAAGAAPGLVYVAAIAALGGLGEMIDQLSAGPLIRGEGAIDGYVRVVPLACIALAWAAAGGRGALRSAAAVLAAAGLGLLLWTTLDSTLEWKGRWGAAAMHALLTVLAVRVAVERVLDPGLIVIGAAAWMAALSFGIPNANLLAGTIALAVADRTLRRVAHAVPPRAAAWAASGLALLAAGACVAVFADARKSFNYVDRPRAELTTSLGDVAPALRGLRTNATTAEYVRQARACTTRFRARRVTIYPDNPGLYAALGLENPMPVDWFYPRDYAGARAKVLAALDRLDRAGDFLFMLQTVNGERLPVLRSGLPNAAVAPPITRDPRLGARILVTLRGRRVRCGSFHAIWRPAAQPKR